MARTHQIASDVSIHSRRQTEFGERIEGENPPQDFVEYWKGGRLQGLILKNKLESFWSLMYATAEGEPRVLTRPLGRKDRRGEYHSWRIIGSKRKETAERMLTGRVLRPGFRGF